MNVEFSELRQAWVDSQVDIARAEGANEPEQLLIAEAVASAFDRGLVTGMKGADV